MKPRKVSNIVADSRVRSLELYKTPKILWKKLLTICKGTISLVGSLFDELFAELLQVIDELSDPLNLLSYVAVVCRRSSSIEYEFIKLSP